MKTGLILIDIQNDYFPGGKMELVGVDRAARNARDLLGFFRDRSLPMFHVQHIFTDPSAPFFLPDTEGVKIHDLVKPIEGETVVQKHFPNAFRESILLEELTREGIERVVFCGAMSHMCVDATTRAAADLGLECILAHDACATRDLEFEGRTIKADEVHGAYMSALGWGYAELVRTADFTARE